MKILVYGFYKHQNMGDDLFMEAYKHLFPNIDFVFTDDIKEWDLDNIDAVFFGGGSFLLASPQITDKALVKLRLMKIFYLGVGVEKDIHPIHIELMSLAKMIATRSPDQLDRLRQINSNVSIIPDLVYSLQDKVHLSEKSPKSVLVMPNINVVPQRSEPHWKHAAWAYFKSEFCQFLDWLGDEGEYHLHLFSMCLGPEADDDWAASELVGFMDNRSYYYMYSHYRRPANFQQMTTLISKHDVVITQRFHGIVLSEMTGTPYIAIHHHDKLKTANHRDGLFLSYYNSSKQLFIDTFEQAIKIKPATSLPDETSTFDAFIKEVIGLL